MKIRANDIDLIDAERLTAFLVSLSTDELSNVEMFCIYKINIIGSNFHAQNVLFSNLQSA